MTKKQLEVLKAITVREALVLAYRAGVESDIYDYAERSNRRIRNERQ
jgi:hypothetical protein